MKEIESALRRQIILEKNNVPCPFLWQCEDRVIRRLDDRTAYMVMDFRSGKTENPDTITGASNQEPTRFWRLYNGFIMGKF